MKEAGKESLTLQMVLSPWLHSELLSTAQWEYVQEGCSKRKLSFPQVDFSVTQEYERKLHVKFQGYYAGNEKRPVSSSGIFEIFVVPTCVIL